MERATLGAGCFWQVEDELAKVPGVVDIAVGYAGGQVENPSYEQVCRGNTGHAEVVDLKFDPSILSYEDLLKKFWYLHDPTTLNRQGPDVGPQYRSVIFYHTPEQHRMARQVRDSLGERFSPRQVVTAIEPFKNFYPAEAYHQGYLAKRRGESGLPFGM